jgi:hypothetical protein
MPGARTPSEAYRRLRLQMIGAERAELLKIRAAGEVDQHVLGQVLDGMDAEEAVLTVTSHRANRVRETPLRAPDQVAAALRTPCPRSRAV